MALAKFAEDNFEIFMERQEMRKQNSDLYSRTAVCRPNVSKEENGKVQTILADYTCFFC